MRKIEYWVTYFDDRFEDGSLQESCFEKFDTLELAEECALNNDRKSIRYLFIRKVFVHNNGLQK